MPRSRAPTPRSTAASATVGIAQAARAACRPARRPSRSTHERATSRSLSSNGVMSIRSTVSPSRQLRTRRQIRLPRSPPSALFPQPCRKLDSDPEVSRFSVALLHVVVCCCNTRSTQRGRNRAKALSQRECIDAVPLPFSARLTSTMARSAPNTDSRWARSNVGGGFASSSWNT